MTRHLALDSRAALEADKSPAAIIARWIQREIHGPSRYRANLLILDLETAGYAIVSTDGTWPPPMQEETP
jgi:hypothetical protein